MAIPTGYLTLAAVHDQAGPLLIGEAWIAALTPEELFCASWGTPDADKHQPANGLKYSTPTREARMAALRCRATMDKQREKVVTWLSEHHVLIATTAEGEECVERPGFEAALAALKAKKARGERQLARWAEAIPPVGDGEPYWRAPVWQGPTIIVSMGPDRGAAGDGAQAPAGNGKPQAAAEPTINDTAGHRNGGLATPITGNELNTWFDTLAKPLPSMKNALEQVLATFPGKSLPRDDFRVAFRQRFGTTQRGPRSK